MTWPPLTRFSCEWWRQVDAAEWKKLAEEWGCTAEEAERIAKEETRKAWRKLKDE